MENQTKQSTKSTRRWLLQPWQAVVPGAASERRELIDELRPYARLLVADAARAALVDDVARAAAEQGCTVTAMGDSLYVTEERRDGPQLLFTATLLLVKGTYDGR